MFSACLFCGNLHKEKQSLCKSCEYKLPYQENPEMDCSDKHYDHAKSLFEYSWPINQLIIELKFQGKLQYAQLLGALMSRHLEWEHRPDAILAVPLHRKRLARRGYNQAHELAAVISQCLELPLLLSPIERTKYTQAQTKLNAQERKNNLKGAFSHKKNKNGHLISNTYKNILIIDDVLTTGSTVDRLSETLKQCPLNHIEVWVCAQAKPGI